MDGWRAPEISSLLLRGRETVKITRYKDSHIGNGEREIVKIDIMGEREGIGRHIQRAEYGEREIESRSI